MGDGEWNFDYDDIEELTRNLEDDLFRMSDFLRDETERLGNDHSSDEHLRGRIAQLHAIWTDTVASSPENPRKLLYNEVAARRIPPGHTLHPTPDMPLVNLLLLISWCRDENSPMHVPDHRNPSEPTPP